MPWLYSPWNSLSQNTRVGSLSLLQEIFPTQGLKPGLPHYRQILYQLSHKGSPLSEVAQLCLTLCNPMDCSLRASSILGIFQARVLGWVAISFSRGSSRPRNQTWVSCIANRCFYHLSCPLNIYWKKNWISGFISFFWVVESTMKTSCHFFTLILSGMKPLNKACTLAGGYLEGYLIIHSTSVNEK